MSVDEIIELAALDAAGALLEDERRALGEALTRADEATRREVAELYRVAAALPPVTDEAPGPQVRERLLTHAFATGAPAPDITVPGFRFVHAHEGWHPHPIPGIMVKPLAIDRDRNTATLLLKAAPGVEYPQHEHSGPEECYVLEGDVTVEGRKLGPGDFHHAEGGSHHDPLRTEGGTTVLLVVSLSDYLG
jgi:quercetin dioxygenase-like cupin family protein